MPIELKVQVEDQVLGECSSVSISRRNSGTAFLWIEGISRGLAVWEKSAKKAWGVDLGEKDVRVPLALSGSLVIRGEKDDRGQVVFWVKEFAGYKESTGGAGNRAGGGTYAAGGPESNIIGRVVVTGMELGWGIEKIEPYVDYALKKLKENK